MNIKLRVLVLAFLTILSAFVDNPLRAADDDDAAHALVGRAVLAMGGSQAVQKTKNQIIDDTGTYYGMGDGLPYKGRFVAAYPDRYRMEIEGQFVHVTDGDKAWVSAMGNVMDLDGVAREVAVKGILASYAVSLIPLEKRDEAFKLGLAKSEAIEGQECPGITIDHEGMSTVTIHFSPKTGLIKKTSFMTRSAESNYEETREDVIIHEYKVFDGVQTPAKITIFHDGEKFVESNPQNVTYPDSIDEAEFKKPE